MAACKNGSGRLLCYAHAHKNTFIRSGDEHMDQLSIIYEPNMNVQVQNSNSPFTRIQEIRRKKLCHLIRPILAAQSVQPPAFITSMKNISKKKKIMSALFYTLLVMNFTACLYQTVDRILYYLDKPTTVDAHLIETTHGLFPYVYVYPKTTQELNNFIAKQSHNNADREQCDNFLTDPIVTKLETEVILKYLSIPSYITDAYFAMYIVIGFHALGIG
uniref:Uncharacterized protein n=1 Tax=Strigamia maritima TaxID=126957 RepID=T1IJG4_STRMM